MRAKQTHLYLLNAYTYWLLLNQKEDEPQTQDYKIDKVIKLLIEEPTDFVQQLVELL